MESDRRLSILRVLVLIFVIGLTIFIISIRDAISIYIGQIPQMQGYAYPAIFLISIVANSTIIIPLPGIAITALMGAFFNPLWVAVAAGAGASLGELSGYLAGFSGQGVIERTKWGDRMIGWMKKYGDVTILVLAAIPNPLFDMAGMTAGALKLPVHRFLIWSCAGKIIKMGIFAYGGATLINWLPI
jgi:membrane protein YqaA with SNARE-associated domain